MKIKRFDTYKDGGTIVIKTEIGDFYIDHRIRTTTPGQFYDGYPSDTKEPIELSKEVKNELANGLSNFSTNRNGEKIDQLITELRDDVFVMSYDDDDIAEMLEKELSVDLAESLTTQRVIGVTEVKGLIVKAYKMGIKNK